MKRRHIIDYIGIDPGITGAIVAITGDGELIDAWRTPTLQGDKGKREYDVPSMVSLLDLSQPAFVGIEKVQAMPRDGRVGAFNFGRGYGIWLGILAALKKPHMLFTPQRWQAKMLAGLPKGTQTKVSAVSAAKSLFPDLPIKVKADWGLADAALIAEYARRQHLGVK
tara:strand:+ start:2176 stop:2676 length:501 start_codon:yes stop_codon:yes gene_type:complete